MPFMGNFGQNLTTAEAVVGRMGFEAAQERNLNMQNQLQAIQMEQMQRQNAAQNEIANIAKSMGMTTGQDITQMAPGTPAEADYAVPAQTSVPNPKAQVQILKAIPQIYTKYGLVDKAEEWNNKRIDQSIKFAGLAKMFMDSKNYAAKQKGMAFFSDALDLMSDSMGISPQAIKDYEQKAIAQGDTGIQTYGKMVTEIWDILEKAKDPKSGIKMSDVRPFAMKTLKRYQEILDEGDEKSVLAEVDKEVASAEKVAEAGLSYHMEKRQLGNQKIQDVRIFTDKQGNIIKEQPVGEPYANTEGVANVRVQAFSQVPTATQGVYFDRLKQKPYEIDPSGQKRYLTSSEVKTVAQQFKMEMPTSDIVNMAQSVPSVMQLIGQTEASLKKTEQNLGPVAGRWREAWSGKVGANDPAFRALKTDIGLLETRLMKMHVGARGGEYIMQHFKEMLNAGKDTPENMRAAIAEIKQYANEVKAGPNAPASVTPAPASGGSKFKIIKVE